MNSLVFLDCETCDLAGGIIELSLATCSSLQELLQIDYAVFRETIQTTRYKNPRPIDPKAFEIHGITEKELQYLTPYHYTDFYNHFATNSITSLDDLAEAYVLIGHNVIGFDRSRLELRPEHHAIDTLVLTRFLEKTGDLTHNNEVRVGNKLDTLVSIYCPENGAHRAEYHNSAADCIKTFLYLRWLLQNPLKGIAEGELVYLSALEPSLYAKRALLKSVQKRANK